MSRKTTLSGLQRGLLLFWSLWYLVAFLTNLFDVLVNLQLLPWDWPAVSNHYLLIEKTTYIYHLPRWVNDLFFFMITAWQAISCILFFRAFLFFHSAKDSDPSIIYEAFGIALALSCAFILSCEIFIVYEIEAVHVRTLIALMVTILFIRIPDSMERREISKS